MNLMNFRFFFVNSTDAKDNFLTFEDLCLRNSLTQQCETSGVTELVLHSIQKEK